LTPPWNSKRLRIVAAVLKAAVIGWLIYGNAQRIRMSAGEFKDPPPALLNLSGIWEVDSFSRDGKIVPQPSTDDAGWRRVIFDRAWGGLRLDAFGAENRLLMGWQVAPESADGNLVLIPSSKENAPVTLKLTMAAPEKLMLTGEVAGHSLIANIHRANEIETRLLNRGFHWINEKPFNR
jgi:hypothetical protein